MNFIYLLFFICISLIVNIYFIEPYRIPIKKKLLSYAFSKMINLVHWCKLGPKYL